MFLYQMVMYTTSGGNIHQQETSQSNSFILGVSWLFFVASDRVPAAPVPYKALERTLD